ncbi:RNA ligase family protein [Chondrinema litorale]|uniref:RNA ligase family protein n=1 Tax=Chondrinema litorale TaxID=2994555 RepID=UPI002542CA72|nr:RNA ligase family protein [Chondrinema litorale]UZR96510.1 RNA ligase family protein [Chondrinema litorale]
MNESRKYCRSLHAQISLGTTSDDRFMPDGYVKAFAQKKELVLTEKLDGQNNCFSKNGVFARSHATPTQHPWDKPMRERWNLIKNDLNNLEIFGENMYGVHSIAYKNLESYFYVFAVREGDRWLSWEEVKFYAAMLDFPTVPEISVVTNLAEVYTDNKDENVVLANWLKLNLGMTWGESVNTSGLLGGYDPETGKDCSEGFVIRDKEGFLTNSGTLPVESNEFDSLFKLVRKSHVKTDVHWSKTWKAASLVNYEKYKWFGYEFTDRI